MSSTTGQPRNRRHISQVEQLRWRENGKQSTKTYTRTAAEQQWHSHHYPPPPRLSPTRTTARNIIIGWNLYEYVGSLLLLLPQRVALCVTTRSRPRQTRHVLPEGRGVAQFPPNGQAGWYVPVLSFGRRWGLSVSKYPTCSNESR